MKQKIKAYCKLFLYYAPPCVRYLIQTYVEKQELKEGLQRMHRTKVTKADLNALLSSLDLDHDVMLHTSMINIGKIQGGAKYVADLFLSKMDLSRHTLLISALPFRGSFQRYLDTHKDFDVRTAPIAMGTINEYLASKDGAMRSIHPTHSVVAIGKSAKEYTKEHHLDFTPFGVHSPYQKLIYNKGKVVLLGATLNNLTLIHAIEDMLGGLHPVKCYLSKTYEICCKDQDGNSLRVKTSCHDPRKGAIRDLNRLRPDLVEQGIMKVHQIGEAELIEIDALQFSIFYLEKLSKGQSIYGHHHVSVALKSKITEIINHLKTI